MSGSIGLRRAAAVLRRGGIVAYPTEGVFGLGCDPWNADAIRRLIALKRRHTGKGFIVLAHSIAQINPFAELLGLEFQEAVLRSWPGPVTWVLPAKPGVPRILTGGRRSLAVRVTLHPIASELCRLAGPIVSTSANRAGGSPIRENLRCRAVFSRFVDAVVPGPLGGLGGPTEIRDARTGIRLR